MEKEVEIKKETTQAQIIAPMESAGFRPCLRLIAAIVVFCFTWLSVHPGFAQTRDSNAPDVKTPQDEQIYINRTEVPQTDYTPVRQRFEMLQRMQVKELQQAQEKFKREENFEISVYKNIDTLFRNINLSSYYKDQAGKAFQSLRQYGANTAVENLGNVLPLHYFRKEGTYTEFINGLPYRSERRVPNAQGTLLFEETFYYHNADRLLIKTTSNGYAEKGGSLIYRSTSLMTLEAGSVWYARNTGPNPTSVYNLVKEITQTTQNLRDGYTTTTHIVYNNDMNLNRAASWTELVTDSRYGTQITQVNCTAAQYDDSNRLISVRKDYTQETKDPDTGKLIISRQWTEQWSNMSYTDNDGQLLASYDITIKDEDGIQKVHRENTWDPANGQLSAYKESITDYFGIVHLTERTNITYTDQGLNSYNETTRTYQYDKTGKLILNTTITVNRESSEYRDGKLFAYTENITDENGLRITKTWQDMVWDKDELVGYSLSEYTQGGVDGEVLSIWKYILYDLKLDKYGRKSQETITTHTVAGLASEGEQADTTEKQTITYNTYDIRGRATAYASVTKTATGATITENITNIVYYKGQISEYDLARKDSTAPNKTETIHTKNEFDQYGRVYRITEDTHTTGKTSDGTDLDLQKTVVTEIDAWDTNGQKTHIIRTTTGNDAPNKTTTEDITLKYDSIGQIESEKVITHEFGTETITTPTETEAGPVTTTTENKIDTTTTKETAYTRDSAGRVTNWVITTMDQFGQKTTETFSAEAVDVIDRKVNALGLEESSKVQYRTPGNLKIEQTANGFNSLGQLVHYTKDIKEYDDSGNLKKQSQESVYLKYDRYGRAVVQETQVIADGVMTVSVETITAFNSLGYAKSVKKLKIDENGATYTENASYKYDNFGRIGYASTSWEDATGEGYRKENINYNSLGQISSRDIKEKNPQDEYYNVNPNIEKQTYTIDYTYDIYGRIITEQAQGTCDSRSFTSTITYTYDGANLVEKNLVRDEAGSVPYYGAGSLWILINARPKEKTTNHIEIKETFTYENGRLADHKIKKSYSSSVQRSRRGWGGPWGPSLYMYWYAVSSYQEASVTTTHYDYDKDANVIKITQDAKTTYRERGGKHYSLTKYRVTTYSVTSYTFDKNMLHSGIDTLMISTDSKGGWLYERNTKAITDRTSDYFVKAESVNYIKLGESDGSDLYPVGYKNVGISKLKKLIQNGDWEGIKKAGVGFYYETSNVLEYDKFHRPTKVEAHAVNQYGIPSEITRIYKYNSRGQITYERTIEETFRLKSGKLTAVLIKTTTSGIKYDGKGRRVSWTTHTYSQNNEPGWEEKMKAELQAIRDEYAKKIDAVQDDIRLLSQIEKWFSGDGEIPDNWEATIAKLPGGAALINEIKHLLSHHLDLEHAMRDVLTDWLKGRYGYSNTGYVGIHIPSLQDLIDYAQKQLGKKITKLQEQRNHELKEKRAEYIWEQTTTRKSTHYFDRGPFKNLESYHDDKIAGKKKSEQPGSTHITSYNLLQQVTVSHNKQGTSYYYYNNDGTVRYIYTKINYTEDGCRVKGWAKTYYRYDQYGQLTRVESMSRCKLKTGGLFSRTGHSRSHTVTEYNYLGYDNEVLKSDHTHWDHLGGWKLAGKIVLYVVEAVILVIVAIYAAWAVIFVAAAFAALNTSLEGGTGDQVWKAAAIAAAAALVSYGIGSALGSGAGAGASAGASAGTTVGTQVVVAGVTAAVMAVVGEHQTYEALNDENRSGNEAFVAAFIAGVIQAFVQGFTTGVVETVKRAVELAKTVVDAMVNAMKNAIMAIRDALLAIIVNSFIAKAVQEYINDKKAELKDKYGEGSDEYREGMEDAQFVAGMVAGIVGAAADILANGISKVIFYIKDVTRLENGSYLLNKNGRPVYYKNFLGFMFDKPFTGETAVTKNDAVKILTAFGHEATAALLRAANAEKVTMRFAQGQLLPGEGQGRISFNSISGDMKKELNTIFTSKKMDSMKNQEVAVTVSWGMAAGDWLIIKGSKDDVEKAYQKYGIGGAIAIDGVAIGVTTQGLKGDVKLAVSIDTKKSAAEIKDSLGKLAQIVTDQDVKDNIELLMNLPKEDRKIEMGKIFIGKQAKEGQEAPVNIYADIQARSISRSTELGKVLNSSRFRMGNTMVLINADGSGTVEFMDEYNRPIATVDGGNEITVYGAEHTSSNPDYKIVDAQTGKELAATRYLTAKEADKFLADNKIKDNEFIAENFKIDTSNIKALVSSQPDKKGEHEIIAPVLRAPVEIIDPKIKAIVSDASTKVTKEVSSAQKGAVVPKQVYIQLDPAEFAILKAQDTPNVMITNAFSMPLLAISPNGDMTSFGVTKNMMSMPLGMFDAKGNNFASYAYNAQGEIVEFNSTRPVFVLGNRIIPLDNKTADGKRFILKFEAGKPKLEKNQVAFVRNEETVSLTLEVWSVEKSDFIPTRGNLGKAPLAKETIQKYITAYEKDQTILGKEDTKLALSCLYTTMGEMALTGTGTGANNEATKHLTKAAQLNPNDGYPHYKLAQAYKGLNNTAKTKESYAKAADLLVQGNEFELARKAAADSKDDKLVKDINSKITDAQDKLEKTKEILANNQKNMQFSAREIEQIKEGLKSKNIVEFNYALVRLNAASVKVKDQVRPIMPQINQQFRGSNFARVNLVNMALTRRGIGADVMTNVMRPRVENLTIRIKSMTFQPPTGLNKIPTYNLPGGKR